jgi:hypothetical protein
MLSHTSQLDTDPIFRSSPFSELQCVSESYIKDLIVKILKKSCDLDLIPAFLFIDCLDAFVLAITQIINISLTTGVVPQSFKHTLVKPLLN